MMLDLTTADAIAFGSLCAALLAAYAGLVRGEQAKHEAAIPPPAGWILVDREGLRDLAGAVEDLAAAIRAATVAGEARDPFGATIRDLLRRIDERSDREF